MKIIRATLIGAATCLAIGFGLSAQAQQSPSAGDAAKGRAKYLAVGCFECHGRSGQGGALNYVAPALVELPMPAEALIAFLRNPAGDMPPYAAAVLSDSDVTDILAFIKSLPGRKDPKTIPLLNQ